MLFRSYLSGVLNKQAKKKLWGKGELPKEERITGAGGRRRHRSIVVINSSHI